MAAKGGMGRGGAACNRFEKVTGKQIDPKKPTAPQPKK